MLCCPVAHYSPLLVPQQRTNLHSALCTPHSASASCQHSRSLLLVSATAAALSLVSCLCLDCLLSLVSRPALRPSPPLAAGRSRLGPRHPTRSTDQLSRLCHPINRLRPPQTAPATITSHPSQHFSLPKQNRSWGYIDSAGWLLSVRSAKGYTFHTNQPLNLLLLLLPASPTIYPPLSALCAHMIFANQPFVHHNAPSPTLPLGLAYLACLAIALAAFVSR